MEPRDLLLPPPTEETAPGLVSAECSVGQRLRETIETVASQAVHRLTDLMEEARAAARAEGEDAGRSQLTAEWAQMLRRLRQTSNPEEVTFWLEDTASVFCPRVAVLSVSETVVQGLRVRGVELDAARNAFEHLDLVLPEAPALAHCVESRETVVAAASPGEVSPQLAKIFEHAPGERVYLFPIVVRGEAAALLYAAPGAAGTDMTSLEWLAQAAGMATEALLSASPPVPPEEPERRSGLVQIAGLSATSLASKRLEDLNWTDLAEEDRQLHLSARRFARVQVAEMRLYHGDAVEQGRRRRNVYGELKTQIDEAREAFRQKYLAASETMVDYLHLELVKSLAHDTPVLLGTGYPGPLV